MTKNFNAVTILFE